MKIGEVIEIGTRVPAWAPNRQTPAQPERKPEPRPERRPEPRERPEKEVTPA